MILYDVRVPVELKELISIEKGDYSEADYVNMVLSYIVRNARALTKLELIEWEREAANL